MKPGYSTGSNAQCVYCTNKAIPFLGSPYPQLPFDINIGMVQRRYHCFRQLQIFPNFHSRPYTRCMTPGYLPGSNAHCVYCTEKTIAVLGSPYPKLPFEINIALVQRRYRCFRQLRSFPNFHIQPYTRCMKPGYLPGSNAQCVYCTEKTVVFVSSPYPKLPFDMNIALVQTRYHCFRQLRSFPYFHSSPIRVV